MLDAVVRERERLDEIFTESATRVTIRERTQGGARAGARRVRCVLRVQSTHRDALRHRRWRRRRRARAQDRVIRRELPQVPRVR